MKNRIAGFDGLRALAVLMVFLQHRLFGDFGEMGHLGVWIFFALSGFLIVGILSSQRARIEAGGSCFSTELRRFLFRRTLRIFPIYYLMLVVMCVLMAFGFANPELAGGMPFHFAYLSNFWIGSVLRYWPGRYSHLWSLAIEEQFYLVVAPLLLLLAVRRHRAACWAIVALGLAALLAMRAAHWDEITIYTHPLSNVWLLALGGVGGLMIANDHGRMQAWLGHGLTLFALSVGVTGLCAAEPMWSALDNPLLFTAISTVYGIGIAALVCSIACCRHAVVISVLQTSWLAALGRISYGFYLYHNLIPDLTRNHHAEAFFGGTVPMWAHALGIVASFAISLGIAVLSWRFIEEPILRLKVRGDAAEVVKAKAANAAEAAAHSAASSMPASLASHEKRSLKKDNAASDVV
ncbi:acyltransferase family protein [Paraburkholderia susongensis]|uniref:Peptidoglycan/LPS O-acetylase OafA/YrhL, contains acyltransferase and SGNH-hydrolase domains n=1 Tax=Paraburkholderia susongensis TaxID=1515439 RepID=A0A1X7M5X3_9BURK|nr:acyltransferase [Paraburkholderia susongensis]SMG61360.1 Peptidoglycan/LPS O-acetylase OafA/YrhL, contains acyltransferase and SGNH-hydrolase domains [Paraburkholderia susongensis]